jgi:hypothetical protein
MLSLQNDVAPHLMDFGISPPFAKVFSQNLLHSGLWAVSCNGQHLITHETQSNGAGRGQVKIERLHRFFNIGSQFLPTIRLVTPFHFLI